MAGERVLVVDDEKGVVRSCVRILQREGFTVSGRTESITVPDLLRQETFDLLLTDIKMPRLDGLALLRIAKEIDPHITVVLITGYGTMEDAIEAIRLGAQGFLMKPFEPHELIDTIKDNLSRRTLIRDSLRLQTLLPLLEINQILQVSGGEISLVRRVLEIAQEAIGATRLAWLSIQPDGGYAAQKETTAKAASKPVLSEALVISREKTPSELPAEAVARVLETSRPLWVLANGDLSDEIAGQPNIVGALLPLIIKGEIVGILTAETGGDDQTGPFGQIGLELLSVLAGQLAIVIENVQLFQQTESLRAFNEDIIQNLTNGLIAIDQSGYITAFNPAAAEMLGCRTEAVLQQPLSTVFSDVEPLVNIFNRTLAGGQAQPYQEISLSRKDSRRLTISVRTALLKGENSRPGQHGVVGVIEDLSEIKALEAERRRLDRLAALGEMAAVVAHEIRNPVAGIAAGVEYLTRNAPRGSTEAEGAVMIQGEVKRVSRILEDILFVARPLQLNFSYETLPSILENVIQRCRPQAQVSKVDVLFEAEETLPALYVDSQRLEQVFTNLIINAIQAMPDGGRLLLQIAFDRDEGDRDEGDRNEGDAPEKVAIRFTDTGPGIPADVQQRIFEPFFTTKAKGTGLGLSIARRIIDEHGGTIDVTNQENQGTCFTIHLPVRKG